MERSLLIKGFVMWLIGATIIVWGSTVVFARPQITDQEALQWVKQKMIEEDQDLWIQSKRQIAIFAVQMSGTYHWALDMLNIPSNKETCAYLAVTVGRRPRAERVPVKITARGKFSFLKKLHWTPELIKLYKERIGKTPVEYRRKYVADFR